jgi:hypothetical protein
VRLGEESPALLTVLGEAEWLSELCKGEDGKNDNPTLTGDLLEIYFSSTRAGLGDADVWFARRDSISEPFGSPQLVTSASSNAFDTSPAISPDGLTLWLGSNRDGAYKVDIYETTRPNRDTDQWYPPRNLERPPNSEEDDIPRPLGQHGQVMPLASRRDGPAYATYFAARGADGVFGPPQAMPELAVEGRSISDGCLTNDGLILLFNAELAENQGDLYLARRSSTAVPFEAPIPLDQLNTAGDDRDPWLSPDESRLFFSSDRDGERCIYQVPVRVRR